VNFRRSRKVERLGVTLEKVLSRRGLAGKLREYRLFGQWEKAVGSVIARHARPSAIRGRKLTVTVDSSAWMQQLSFLKPEILARVNRCLGEEAVIAIALRIGELDLPAPQIHEERQPAGQLDAGERRKVEEYVAAIADPEVRESFRRMIERDLLSKKWAGKK
jgi:predicted nucleic acid-binding Zn ribbon protein